MLVPLDQLLTNIRAKWTARKLLVPNGAMLAVGFTGDRMNTLVGATFVFDDGWIIVGETAVPCTYLLGEAGVAASIFYYHPKTRTERESLADFFPTSTMTTRCTEFSLGLMIGNRATSTSCASFPRLTSFSTKGKATIYSLRGKPPMRCPDRMS